MTRTTAAEPQPSVPNLCPPPVAQDVVRISAPEWRAFLALAALGVAALAWIACTLYSLSAVVAHRSL